MALKQTSGIFCRALLGVRYYSSSSKLVDVQVNDKNGIAIVTLQRPPVNGLNLELINNLSSTIDELEKNKSKGLILTSVSYVIDVFTIISVEIKLM